MKTQKDNTGLWAALAVIGAAILTAVAAVNSSAHVPVSVDDEDEEEDEVDEVVVVHHYHTSGRVRPGMGIKLCTWCNGQGMTSGRVCYLCEGTGRGS